MSAPRRDPHPLVASQLARRTASHATPRSQAGLADAVRRPARLGVSMVAVFVAGAIGWASLAPIAAGSIAPGLISPDGSRRTVQHLEGGIIREIKVRDGDEVTAGQPLVVLQDIQAAAVYDVLLDQANLLTATRARLSAEQIGSDAIVFPSDLLAASEADSRVRAIVRGQTALFDKRRATLQAQLDILDDRESQFAEQIVALEAQLQSTRDQIDFLAEELAAKEPIYQKGLVPKPEMLRLERSKAALEGDHGRLLGSIAEVKQRIGELGSQRISAVAERAQEVSAELEDTRSEYATVTERLAASRDVLERTMIAAPVSGKVVNSRFKTTGGVVRPGDAILDIVPTGERLLIDAHVSPSDIDVVHAGLAAVVHLTAYSSRGLPRIHGTVREVSADRIVDPDSRQAYFLARVEVSKEDLDSLGDEVKLMPGMPAEVMIVTGERTTMGYLLEPFMAALRRGMRET